MIPERGDDGDEHGHGEGDRDGMTERKRQGEDEHGHEEREMRKRVKEWDRRKTLLVNLETTIIPSFLRYQSQSQTVIHLMRPISRRKTNGRMHLSARRKRKRNGNITPKMKLPIFFSIREMNCTRQKGQTIE